MLAIWVLWFGYSSYRKDFFEKKNNTESKREVANFLKKKQNSWNETSKTALDYNRHCLLNFPGV